MRRAPGEIVHRYARSGVVIRFSPSIGSSVKYRVTCPHGNGVNARTLEFAHEDARCVTEWCDECADAQTKCAHGIYLDGVCAECREEETGTPERDNNQDVECDVCPVPATIVRPATKNRELAYYCDDCAKRSLDSWGDTFHRLDGITD